MILIPYFWKSDANWATFGIFLCEGGRSLWSIEDKTSVAAAKKLLVENGFPVLKVVKKDSAIYAEISPDLNLADYYLWNEMTPGSSEDVWRTFRIPMALWPCPVFNEIFCRESKLPEIALAPLIDKASVKPSV